MSAHRACQLHTVWHEHRGTCSYAILHVVIAQWLRRREASSRHGPDNLTSGLVSGTMSLNDLCSTRSIGTLVTPPWIFHPPICAYTLSFDIGTGDHHAPGTTWRPGQGALYWSAC